MRLKWNVHSFKVKWGSKFLFANRWVQSSCTGRQSYNVEVQMTTYPFVEGYRVRVIYGNDWNDKDIHCKTLPMAIEEFKKQIRAMRALK